jgi:hypothetical protein
MAHHNNPFNRTRNSAALIFHIACSPVEMLVIICTYILLLPISLMLSGGLNHAASHGPLRFLSLVLLRSRDTPNLSANSVTNTAP